MPFTASIIERQFAYVPDKILKLGGAAWLRPLGGPALTTPFERIRIGVLCSVTQNAASNIADTLFLMGLCAGNTNPGSAFFTDNFLGTSLIGSPVTGSTRLLTYTANAGNPYYAATAGVGMRKCSTLSATPTITAGFSAGIALPVVGMGTVAVPSFYSRRAIIIVDITQTPGGAGNVTMTVYFSSTAATLNIDMRPDTLFDALDTPGTPTVRGATLTSQSSTSTLTYSDLFGALDHFEIYWSNVTFPLEISAIGATVIRNMEWTGASSITAADDSFEEYAISSGSITPTIISNGSGWSGDGSLARDVANYGNFQATSNYAAQVYAAFVGTTYNDDDPYQQYAVGTVSYGSQIALGSYWGGEPTLNSPTTNLIAQEYNVLAGTNFSPFDTIESYATNSTSNGSTTSFAGGSFWASAGTVYSYGSVLYAGTTMPNFLPIATNALVGTVYSVYDSFDNYAAGTVDSDITINAGSYWSGNGIVTVYDYP